MIEIPYCSDLGFVVTIYKVVKTFPVFLSGPKVLNNIMFWLLVTGLVFFTSETKQSACKKIRFKQVGSGHFRV